MFEHHRVITKSVLTALACVIALVTSMSLKLAASEHQDAAEDEKVVAFLNSNLELRKSFTCRFKGEFRPIPIIS